MHNGGISAPDNKIYFNQECIWTIFVHVCDILHWVDILDFIRNLLEFFPNYFFQQHNTGFQQYYFVPDYRIIKKEIKNFGASKVLRQLPLPRLATRPFAEKLKRPPFGDLKISGASKGARTLDLNLGKVAL